MKNNLLLTMLLFLVAFTNVKAQEFMVVEMKDHSLQKIKVEDIYLITFQTEGQYPVADAIDLGLPSGTLWASWNIGASSPEEYGGYFAWGEIENKDYYDWSTYIYCDGTENSCHNIGNDIAGTQYDVAHMKWGGDWRMPTMDQIKELMNYCTRKWTTQNGVYGTLVTGPNGNTIFLPAAGHRWEDDQNGEGSVARYWSSSIDSSRKAYAYLLGIYSNSWTCVSGVRGNGRSVRAVIIPKPFPKAVDLGLPSGIKWANCNVGATAPEEYGGYYAWGETEEKDYYDWSTYTHCDGLEETCHHISDDIAGTEYDVAHVKWGGNWRMPTIENINELMNYCTRKWTTQNGVYGTLVTGPNGNSIFLPAAGHKWNSELGITGATSYYWSSSLTQGNEELANYLFFDSSNWSSGGFIRSNGHSVRPVCP